MLTSAVESNAASGDLSSPDVNLLVLLRRNVIPAFLSDVGYVSWRRKTSSFTCLTDGTQSYDLPDDFWQLQVVTLGLTDDDMTDVTYIGDDAPLVLLAEAATDQAKPTGYYLTRRTTSLVFKKLKFNCPPDQAYVCRYSYYSGIEFTDDTTAVDLDKYIPAQFQWTLVEGLKRELYKVRYGQGDDRYTSADDEYQRWLARAIGNPELSHRSAVAYVR